MQYSRKQNKLCLATREWEWELRGNKEKKAASRIGFRYLQTKNIQKYGGTDCVALIVIVVVVHVERKRS